MATQRDQQVLAAAFAGLSSARHQYALEITVRRRILRSLEEAVDARSPAELAIEVDAPLSAVSYHARVLSACGLASSEMTPSVLGTVQERYVATVGDDANVATILAVTRAEDDGP